MRYLVQKSIITRQKYEVPTVVIEITILYLQIFYIIKCISIKKIEILISGLF